MFHTRYNTFAHRIWRRVGAGVIAPAVFLLASAAAHAQTPSVTAVLSNSETAVGQPVQLQIEVSGVSNPTPPGDIEVDGLDIRSAGISRHYQMQNFNVSYSFTYNYTVMPLRAGTFKIPPQTVQVAGKPMQTPELTLTVAAGSGRSSRRQRDEGSIDPANIGFLEMLLPKGVAYVGEMVPVQVRLGINARAPVESLGSGIQIAGQGFTTQKIPEARQTIETIKGRTYSVWIFKTAIAAVRPGKLDIGPAEINPVVRVARNVQRNQSLPRDLFDDPFFNNFFNDPAFAPSVPKEIKLKSEGATLEVKPLPPNAPPEFAGAVGTFTLKSDANPKRAQVGDPITVSTSIHGRGNFDRVTAPTLADESGWHAYPPTDKFNKDDDVGISGEKVFETVLSAKGAKDKLPPLVFAFFDPIKENYVTLRSNEIPLRIEGAALAASPSPAGATAAAPAAAASPSATPPPQAADILHQITAPPARAQSFKPLHTRPAFWLAQLVPLLALVGFAMWKMQQARAGDRAAQRIAALQRDAAELQRKLRTNGVTPAEYLSNASRAVQLKTALAKNIDPNAVDAETAADAFRLDEAERARLRQLFHQSDELRYSGARNGGHAISTENQREILALLDKLHA